MDKEYKGRVREGAELELSVPRQDRETFEYVYENKHGHERKRARFPGYRLLATGYQFTSSGCSSRLVRSLDSLRAGAARRIPCTMRQTG